MRYLRNLTKEVTDGNLKKMLHILWETPPYSSGGLAVASYDLALALNNSPTLKVDIATPTLQSSSISPDTGKQALTHYKIPLSNSTSLDLNIAYSNPTKNLTTLALFEQLSSQDLSLAQLDQLKENQEQHPDSISSFASAVRNCHFTSYHSIHAHDWMTASAAAMAKTSHLPAKPPLVLHLHSTQLERHGLQSRGSLFHHELWAMQQADIIITVSQLSKEIITQHYQIPASKIHVAHNSSNSPDQRPKVKDPKQHKTILFAARLVDQKSPELAVEIISRVLRKTPNTKAIIAGDGEKLAAIRALVKFKKISDRVEVIGQVPHDKMHIVYASSDILILPSALEPFGLVALEAAYAGVAVVLSDCCGAAEILTSAPTISTQDIDLWENTITHLIQNDSARNLLIGKQTKEVQSHSWEPAANTVTHAVSTYSPLS